MKPIALSFSTFIAFIAAQAALYGPAALPLPPGSETPIALRFFRRGRSIFSTVELE